MARVFNQRPGYADRNRQIWEQRAAGVPVAQLAAEHGMSESRVSQVLKQYAATIPPADREETRKLVGEFYDQQLAELWEIALAAGKQRIAPNGKPIYSADGVPEVDNGEKLAAHGMITKVMALRARLYGVDAPAAAQIEISREQEQRDQKDAFAILRELRERQELRAAAGRN